jgi:hypothetical protein
VGDNLAKVYNLRKVLFKRIPHPLRIKATDFTPEFNTVPIKIDEGRGKFKIIDRSQLTPDFLLNVEADEKDLIPKFVFELVHDGLYSCACNSVGGLEFH